MDAASTPEHCDGQDNDGDTQTDEGYDWTRPGGGDPNGIADCLEDVDTDGDTSLNPVDDEDDGDDFDDVDEQWMTTDELDSCPDGANPWGAEKDDAWPPDFNADTVVDITDYLLFSAAFPSTEGSSNYNRRMDMNGDTVIDTTDALTFLAYFPSACTNP